MTDALTAGSPVGWYLTRFQGSSEWKVLHWDGSQLSETQPITQMSVWKVSEWTDFTGPLVPPATATPDESAALERLRRHLPAGTLARRADGGEPAGH